MIASSSIVAKNGMVASAHKLASSCGANILLRGGNVVDAAIATSAALCVVQNNSCGLGGDTFALIKLGGKILEINGSGRAAMAATIDYYEKLGYSAIPEKGPLSCITVPGLVHAWGELVRYASMDLAELLVPAIEYAERGVPLNAKYVESIIVSSNTLRLYDSWSNLFMPNGIVPQCGFVLKQKELAQSLRMIAKEGASTFYDGNLAEKIVSGVKEAGGLLDSEDLRTHRSTWKNPLFTDYRGTRIYETSPNSQGATVLLWLNILEERDLSRLSLNEVQNLLVETCLKAYERRATSIADPVFFDLPSNFVSKEFARKVSSASLQQNLNRRESSNEGDTTYFAVGDREGNCVSMIQSNYMGFGSGVVPKSTGFVLHNRGCYFSLERSHHNSLLPGKRTFHTLCASLGERDQKTVFALGTMGGDIQPQVHVQLLVKLLDFGIGLQEAIDSPRWFIPGTIYEPLSTICFEKGLVPSGGIPRHLKIERMDELSSLAGHANAVAYSGEDILGGADPRCEGSAVGF